LPRELWNPVIGFHFFIAIVFKIGDNRLMPL